MKFNCARPPGCGGGGEQHVKEGGGATPLPFAFVDFNVVIPPFKIEREKKKLPATDAAAAVQPKAHTREQNEKRKKKNEEKKTESENHPAETAQTKQKTVEFLPVILPRDQPTITKSQEKARATGPWT